MAQSYLHNTSHTSGAAAEVAADKKTAKYAPLAQTRVFVPIAVETMGAINSDGLEFLGDLGWEGALHKSQMISASLPSCSSACQFLFSAYNAVAIQGTFAHTTSEDELWAVPAYLLLALAFNSRDLYYRG